jgi:hypothetical protein
MSKKAKLAEKILEGPLPKDITADKLMTFLRQRGYVTFRMDGGGDHVICVFTYPDGHQVSLPVPMHAGGGPVKAVYIKEIREIIEDLEANN